MTFVQSQQTPQDNALKMQGVNPFGGISKLLDAKFSKTNPLNEITNANSQNFNVQNNPFNNIENIANGKQLIGGHSLNYIMSPNSVFDIKNTQQSNQNGYRDPVHGGLNFDS